MREIAATDISPSLLALIGDPDPLEEEIGILDQNGPQPGLPNHMP